MPSSFSGDFSGGDLAEEYAAVDWAATSLGPPETWTPTLRWAVELVRGTRFPATLLWGPDLVLLYNEAYIGLVGDKHPRALGRTTKEIFPEAWDQIGPMLHGVLQGDPATWDEGVLVPIDRAGYLEEVYFTFSYSPVRSPEGHIEGVIDIAVDSTPPILATRRITTVVTLDRQLEQMHDLGQVVDGVDAVLRSATADFLAVDLTLIDAAERRATGTTDDDVVVTSDETGRTATVSLGQGRARLQLLLNPMLRIDEPHLDFLRLLGRTLAQHLSRLDDEGAARALSLSLQHALLTQPRHSASFDVAVHYEPAALVAEVGGDWHDAFPCGDDSLMVSIGDVFGHDHQAAGVMAQLRNLLRGIAHLDGGSPAQALSTLERVMPGLGLETMATTVLGTVGEPVHGTATFTWSNAGHPPPVLICPDGVATLLERPADALIGLDPHTPRHDHEVELVEGSTVLLYTDGLVERRGESLDLGLARLVEHVQGCQRMSADDIVAHTMEILSGVSSTEDDVAIVVLRLQVTDRESVSADVDGTLTR